jgi:hypothetical protein
MSSEGSYMTSVVITALTVMTFFILVLAFLYMIWGKGETTQEKES